MNKKSVLAALVLITAGIIIGVLLVSNISGGVAPGYAGTGGEVKLGGPAPAGLQNQTLSAFQETFVAVSKALTPSVVAIRVTTTPRTRGQEMPRDFWHFFGPDTDEPQQGYGSGVIIAPEGYIVTNNHVVENAGEEGIEVTLHDKTRLRATLVGADPSTDLAVIKVEQTGLTTASLGNSEDVRVGEWALAIGNPLGLTSTVTAGIISAIGRNIRIIDSPYGIEDFIQTDAAINPGNSGGALVNLKGEVIGINTAIATTNARYQGYGFAVPVNLMKIVAADLIKYGEVRRGYIGVNISEVDRTVADAIGLKEAKGVLVQRVQDGGAGQAAGLRDGDVILSVDGKEVNAPNELQATIATRHAGDKVTLKVFRNGSVLEKTVTLQQRQKESASVPTSGTPSEEKESPESVRPVKFETLGMSVRALSAQEKRQLGVENGVLVTDVVRFSEAFNRAIQTSDVIVEADRKEVASPSQLKKIIESKKPGDSILLRVRKDDAMTFVAVQIPK